MTQMSVGEFKRDFSEALRLVRGGEEIEVLYGRAKEPVARLVPSRVEKGEGLLGLLAGKASFTMSEDWSMSPEELLEL